MTDQNPFSELFSEYGDKYKPETLATAALFTEVASSGMNQMLEGMVLLYSLALWAKSITHEDKIIPEPEALELAELFGLAMPELLDRLAEWHEGLKFFWGDQDTQEAFNKHLRTRCHSLYHQWQRMATKDGN